MKKSLKIRSLREKEVPSSLDAIILTAASFHLKRKKRRMIWQFFSAAAAACIVCLVLVGQESFSVSPALKTGLPDNRRTAMTSPAVSPDLSAIPVSPQKKDSPRLTTSELLAMGDFTTLEQETFAFDQTSYASGISGDAMM